MTRIKTDTFISLNNCIDTTIKKLSDANVENTQLLAKALRDMTIARVALSLIRRLN